MSEANTIDTFFWIMDFSCFLEHGYMSLDDVLYNNPKISKLDRANWFIPYEDEGLVFAECGCLDVLKSFWHDPYTRFTSVNRTYYHSPWCAYDGFPISHWGVGGPLPDLFPENLDHLQTSSWKAIKDVHAKAYKAGVPLGYNFFETDTMVRFADIIQAKVDSINNWRPKTRNWAEENLAHPH